MQACNITSNVILLQKVFQPYNQQPKKMDSMHYDPHFYISLLFQTHFLLSQS